jgi:hypothetical protein
MEAKSTLYEICIEGQLDSSWSDWFEGMVIVSPSGHVTFLRGILPDQAALFGVLKRLHNLGVVLISVRRI